MSGDCDICGSYEHVERNCPGQDRKDETMNKAEKLLAYALLSLIPAAITVGLLCLVTNVTGAVVTGVLVFLVAFGMLCILCSGGDCD